MGEHKEHQPVKAQALNTPGTAEKGDAAETPPAALKKPKAEDKIAKLEARAETIKNQLAQLKARQRTAARKLDNRRKFVIGGTVMAEMQADPDFHAAILKILKRRVTRKEDKQTIADLLNPDAQRGTSGEPSLPN